MKNLLLSFAALTVVGACATAPAFAQEIQSPVGVSIRVGSFDPSFGPTVSNTGTSWLAAGFDYKLAGLKMRKFLPPGYFSVSIDYAGKGSFRSAPLLLNYTSGKTLYWSAGLGVNFARFPQDDGLINDKVRFAYSGALGLNFVNGQIPLFLEVRYFGCEMPRVGGTAIYIGGRF
jgi:hypothetical protein